MFQSDYFVLGDKKYVSNNTSIPLPSGRFKLIEHDFQANDDKNRVGFPEVYPLVLSRYCDLTESWQWFWFRQLVHSFTNFQHWDERELQREDFELLKRKWKSITKGTEAFTNFRGVEKLDYINDIDLGGNPGQEPLHCCGNIVKVLGNDVRISGRTVTPIETLDGSKPPPLISKINRLTAPHIIFCATNVSKNLLSNGVYEIDPFPHLEPRDTLVPVRTHGGEAVDLKNRNIVSPAGAYVRDGVNYAVNYILSDRLMDFSGSTVPRPYYP